MKRGEVLTGGEIQMLLEGRETAGRTSECNCVKTSLIDFDAGNEPERYKRQGNCGEQGSRTRFRPSVVQDGRARDISRGPPGIVDRQTNALGSEREDADCRAWL